MTDFHTHQIVTGRKPHICEHCRREIAIGEQHRKCAQVWEGDFHSYREHLDCHEAWNELNFDLRDIYPTEGAPFLSDDNHEEDDRAWMREKYPAVAERLGWTAP